MDIRELEELFTNLESDRVERKSSLSDRDKIRQTICAFANDLPDYRQPGVIFIGVDDHGNCTHQPITDEMLRTLADMRTSVQPFASLTVQKHILSGCEVAVVMVQPSYMPPVRYEGRVWVRVGPRRAIATPDEERRLIEKRRAFDLPFDVRPVPAASLDDLDLDYFRKTYLPAAVASEILEQNERTVEQQLASLRFVASGQPLIPTNLSILVAGKQSRMYIPGSYVQFIRFDGNEITDPIKSQKEIAGTISDVMTMLDTMFQAHISVSLDVSMSMHIQSPDYPIIALQQLARNAILHRDYEGSNAPVRISWFEDRIEITNPGGPFGQVNRSNFGKPGITDYRNPHLAEAMKNLGYVQRFGMGIALARREMEKNGNPSLDFVVEDSRIVVILRRKL